MTALYYFNLSTRSSSLLLFMFFILIFLLWMDSKKRGNCDVDRWTTNKSPYNLVCYYTFNSTFLVPELIDASLCTHINVAFAEISPSNFSVELSKDQLQLLSRVISVTSHSNVKVLISVGGAGSSNFGPMVTNHANRKLFIRSLMKLIKTFNISGVDLDWEWPVIDGGPRQKVQLIQLLHEIRVEFNRHKKKYTLSAAVAATESIVQASYYVQHIAEHVDFVNIMSYDYHFFNKMYPMTDYNAPLYSSPTDAGGALANFNVNYTVHLWLSLGMPPEKIILGLPSYGHTYRLRNAENHGRLAPAEGFGFGNEGFVSYSEVCKFLHSNLMVTVVRDPDVQVPYAYDFENWVSYDDVESLIAKVEFAQDMQLGGVMLFSLNDDDYAGNCLSKPKKFPLLKAVNAKLFN